MKPVTRRHAPCAPVDLVGALARPVGAGAGAAPGDFTVGTALAAARS